jgi:ankyrin repeat protein
MNFTLLILQSVFAAFIFSSFNDVVKDQSVDKIAIAIKKGADVNQKARNGETPLITAIKHNKEPVAAAELLIRSGANVNTPDNTGLTPLHCSVALYDENAALTLAELLVRNGALIDVHGGFERTTPLMNACGRKNNIGIVRFLIKNRADVNASDSRKETPLHKAVSADDNTEIIKLLIENGADVNAGLPENTPLHRAAYMGAAKNIAVLLANGAVVNARGETSESKTPLETAVDNKHFDAAHILAEGGADINTTTYYFFQPFRYRNNQQSYASKLVHGDVNRIQFEKMTPLHRTITHNNYDFASYLIEKGARLNTDAHFGGFPLDFSLYLDYDDISELLIRHKAPSLFADIYLRDAIENGNYKKTEMLLRAGAAVNKVHDTFYDTPLHIAAEKGAVDIVKLLLAHGADKKIKNRDGKTAAEHTNNREIRELLSAQ